MVCLSSSIADKYSTLLVTFEDFTLLYGLSIKPYLLIFAYVAKLFIRPIFGPSGVSIGHILP